MEAYIQYNKDSWNKRVQSHLESDFYAMPAFRQGKNSLNAIELDLLGELQGKKILHLQCHFGQDTLSLARLGARVTGVDFSEKAIEAARQIQSELQLEAQFICTDLYALPDVLEEQFDVVFTSYGTIGWLPDLDRWAKVIQHFLKPSGQFIMADFHPVVWMFDDDFKEVAYDYFQSEDIVETVTGTYAATDAPFESTTISWNHSLAELFEALFANGLQVKRFQEFAYSPYPCFKNTVEVAPGQFKIQSLKKDIPMVYALKAVNLSHE